MDNFILININASRISNIQRVTDLLNLILVYNASVICIQEINVFSALKVFQKYFQVVVNYDLQSNSNIGIVTLISNNILLSDQILSLDGRILGVKSKNFQIWNVYPISGGENRKNRETFFREGLTNLMMNWKDSTKYLFQSGDHNCTYRLKDSLHNPEQHLQQGLISHLKVHGLKDGFCQIHGENVIAYSRETKRSATRIDYIFSNSDKCTYFEYIDTFLGFDHKMVLGKYDIDFEVKKEFIPKNKFFRAWIIPKYLEEDKVFHSEIRDIYQEIFTEFELNGKKDASFYWERGKFFTVKFAKQREKQITEAENGRINILNIFYEAYLNNMAEGNDSKRELLEIKKELSEFQNNKSKKLINKIRGREIDDDVYDIHTLQKERSYENSKTISEIKINDLIYQGTERVVGGIQKEMEEELRPFSAAGNDDPPSQEEKLILDLIPQVVWTEEEIETLVNPVDEDEISQILSNEVDLDSSPGIDGITYRFIKLFWSFDSYKKLYLHFLNSCREQKNMGYVQNIGMMVVKNKKGQSIEYSKKRKLTKVNKDLNLGHGKVWTNRMKKIVLPKILPKNQFNCQQEVNIIDEIREIRDVNHFLLGKGDNNQIDGTILSIDFNNAYRSVSLRWFHLVMKKFNIPSEFINWFWMMYANLGIMIVINNCKSKILKIERGFMEGHPPSMAAFVVSMIPLMIGLERVLSGIKVDKVKHKIKAFADDLKIFLLSTEEINPSYKVIEDFEKVSGFLMHRDPNRKKCQALPFGKHKNFKFWPEWVTVSNSIKVVGVIYSNTMGQFEKLNGDLVQQNFNMALHQWSGTRGTLHQKVYIANTFLFTKVWYLAQVVKLDLQMLGNLLKKAQNFIHAGENERPVHALNFRDREKGGLGIIHVVIKSKSLLIKNMYKEAQSKNLQVNEVTKLYGYPEILIEMWEKKVDLNQVKSIYSYLMEKITFKNGSVIPSRSEKRLQGVKWGLTWANLNKLKGLNAKEKDFAWKVTQDMLPIGRRIHRGNIEKKCLRKLDNDSLCQYISDLDHLFVSCPAVTVVFGKVKEIVCNFLQRNISDQDLFLLSFNHRNKKKLKLSVWFVIKCLYSIYVNKAFNNNILLAEMRKALNWNLELLRKIGSIDDMKILLNLLK